MTRVAIYTRISRDVEERDAKGRRQERERGVQRQEKACKKLAREKGWTVAAVYRENDRSAFSDRLEDRPVLARLLEEADVEILVAWANDRLYRGPQVRLDVLKVARAKRWKIHTVQEGETDPATASGRMLLSVLGELAEFESSRKAERVLAKHRELAEAGLWQGGPRPFGYAPRKTAAGTTLDVVPEEAAAIRNAAGRLLDGEALRSVVRRWNAAGLRTSWGNEWTARALKGVLTSPGISGQREHQGEILGKTSWPAIIDRKTFHDLAAEFERRAEDVAPPINKKYLLTGLLRCATCGAALVGHPVKGRRSYTCLSKKQEHPRGARPRIDALAVEEYLILEASERDVQTTTVRDPSAVARELQEELDEIEEQILERARRGQAAGFSAAELRAGREDLVRRRGEIEALIEEQTAPRTSRSSREWWEPGTEIGDWIERGAPEWWEDPETRAALETMLDHALVRPAGRSKWVPVADRVDVVWRD